MQPRQQLSPCGDSASEVGFSVIFPDFPRIGGSTTLETPEVGTTISLYTVPANLIGILSGKPFPALIRILTKSADQ
ncbi:unnamed protein product [Linum trigynum]|uniref:Uncharacterized protein n=1 Tax=Linum trigynum TaxID=586398 RepID=A0AAV2DCZ4_9ROSI